MQSSMLEEVLDRIRIDENVPGVSAAIYREGRVTSAQSGIAVASTANALTDESRFEMSCLMKLLVSLAVLKATEELKVDLDAPVSSFIPELKYAVAVEGEITLSDLLLHQSGYRGVDISDAAVRWHMSWPKFVEHFHNHRPSFPAGSVANYEHTEHVVLGEFLSRLVGMPALDFIRQKFLDPLAISLGTVSSDARDSRVFVGQHVPAPGNSYTLRGLPPPAPFWATSLPNATIRLADVLKIGSLIADEQSDSGDEFISRRTRDKLMCAGVPLGPMVGLDPRSERLPVAFGFGCSHFGNGVLGQNGSASGQAMGLRIFPGDRCAVAVAVNAWLPSVRDRLFCELGRFAGCEALANTGPTPHPEACSMRDLLGQFPTDAICGSYLGSYGTRISVAAENGGIQMSLGNSKHAPRLELFEESDGRISSVRPVPISLGFFRDPVSSNPALRVGVHAYKRA